MDPYLCDYLCLYSDCTRTYPLQVDVGIETQSDPSALDALLFDIADQFSNGISVRLPLFLSFSLMCEDVLYDRLCELTPFLLPPQLVTDSEEKVTLSELFLAAGRRSKQSYIYLSLPVSSFYVPATYPSAYSRGHYSSSLMFGRSAYQTAEEYLKIGIQLCESLPDAWHVPALQHVFLYFEHICVACTICTFVISANPRQGRALPHVVRPVLPTRRDGVRSAEKGGRR